MHGIYVLLLSINVSFSLKHFSHSVMQSGVSYYNHLMIDMCSVCARYYKPVVVACCQQFPITHYCMDKSVSQLHNNIQDVFSLSDSKSKERLSYIEAIASIGQTVSGICCIEKCPIGQAEQVGRDELVIAASSYNWYSHDYIHTIVCRYCREEMNSCYYEDHLVSCLESYKCGLGDCVVVDKMVQVTGRQVTGRQVNQKMILL